MFTLTSYEEHDVDADPVLFLPCGHFFAASTLDGHIEIRKVYEMNEYGDFTAIKSLQGNDVSEKAKQCPDCRAVIHSVRRYNRLLRLVELRCLERKHMGTANEALKVLQERLKGSASDDQVIAPLNQLEQSIRKSPMRIVYEACQGRTALDSDPPSGPLIRCLELKGMYYGQRTKQYKDRHYQDARKAYQSGISIADTSSSRQSGARLRLSLAKLTVRCCVDVEEIRNRVNKLLNWILKESQIEASNPLFVDAQKLTNELSRMSRLDKIKEVMKAMTKDLASGYDYGTSAASHWYECPNGHPYFIGECGGAMQESTCPECGARVGGRSHQSAEGNRHVSGMFRDALSYL